MIGKVSNNIFPIIGTAENDPGQLNTGFPIQLKVIFQRIKSGINKIIAPIHAPTYLNGFLVFFFILLKISLLKKILLLLQ